MKKNVLSIIAFAVLFVMLTAIIIIMMMNSVRQQIRLESLEQQMLIRLEMLEENMDTDIQVDIKECEKKTMQTAVNIFSPVPVTKESTLEYDFDYFTDEGYEQYLSQQKTFSGKQLITCNANGSSYDGKTERINVFLQFYSDADESRMQYNFVFTEVDDNWIVESISSDA